MKPGVSLETVSSFPIARANWDARSTTSGEVCNAAMISTSFITFHNRVSVVPEEEGRRTGTGLKKCSPTTRAAEARTISRLVSLAGMAAAAIEVREMEDVLEARIAEGGQKVARLAKILRLSGKDSETAYDTSSGMTWSVVRRTSTTRSTELNASGPSTATIRARASTDSCSVSLPFLTSLAKRVSRKARPLDTTAGELSATRTFTLAVLAAT